MANKRLVQVIEQDLGWCCPRAFIHFSEIKRHSSNPMTAAQNSAQALGNRSGLCERTIFNLRARFKLGELECAGKPNCLLKRIVAEEKKGAARAPKD